MEAIRFETTQELRKWTEETSETMGEPVELVW